MLAFFFLASQEFFDDAISKKRIPLALVAILAVLTVGSYRCLTMYKFIEIVPLFQHIDTSLEWFLLFFSLYI
jgi:hypothetical protein